MDPSPSDEEVLGVLRRYLAAQDLMTVYVHHFIVIVFFSKSLRRMTCRAKADFSLSAQSGKHARRFTPCSSTPTSRTELDG
jgi:hypothetical protein